MINNKRRKQNSSSINPKSAESSSNSHNKKAKPIGFTPKQNLSPSIDLLAIDFEFFKKQNKKIELSDVINLKKDLCPYYKISSLTTIFILLSIGHLFWYELSEQIQVINSYFYENHQINKFWENIIIIFVYVNFMVIIGAYLESTYKFWYVSCYILTYITGYFVGLWKYQTTDLMGQYHIFYSTYSLYSLILVEKKLKMIKFIDFKEKIQKLSVWQYLTKKKQDNIQFALSQRPLSIKGGQNEESFSYDAFFTYNQPLSQDQQKKCQTYFESNISRRSNFISKSFHQIQSPGSKPSSSVSSLPFYKFKKSSTDSTMSQINSIMDQDYIKAQKKKEEMQLIKIYKCFILSFFIYCSVNRIEWISYIVSICLIMMWVQLLINEKLRIIKFICLGILVFGIILIM